MIKSLLTNRPDMLVLSTHWQTRHFMVRKLLGKRVSLNGTEHVTNAWPD